jgi:intracellular sulfur oxidation DsrE/DsrF family protein
MKKALILASVAIITASLLAQTASHSTPKKSADKKESVENPIKIVFQLSIGDTLAHKALMKQLGNINSVEPNTQIEVVCHGPGLDMLHKEKSTVSDKIYEFSQKGIVFNACEFSMKERNVNKEQILPSARFVKAGIIYIVTKQREGWSYIKAGF